MFLGLTFNVVVGELLDNTGNLVCNVRADLAEGYFRHDGRDEDGAGALQVVHRLGELRSVPAAARDLSIPGVAMASFNG